MPAPWLLVSAGLAKGRTLTSYHTIQDDIRNAGGKWVDETVKRDGNWVTSRQPTDIPAFNAAMIELIAEPRQNRTLRGENFPGAGVAVLLFRRSSNLLRPHYLRMSQEGDRQNSADDISAKDGQHEPGKK